MNGENFKENLVIPIRFLDFLHFQLSTRSTVVINKIRHLSQNLMDVVDMKIQKMNSRENSTQKNIFVNCIE